jgi:hypothetical protein
MNLATDTVIAKQIQHESITRPMWIAKPSSWTEGDPIGWGSTREEATDHLLDQIQMRVDYIVWANQQSALL